MYLWKTNKLAEDLKNDLVEENDFFQYVLAYAIFMDLIFEMLSYSDPYPVNQTSLLKSGIIFFIIVIGVYQCYRINSNGDNQKFVERFFSLGVPLTVKFIFLMVLLVVFLEVLSGLKILTWTHLVFSYQFIEILLSFLVYWRLYVHMKFVSH